MGAFAALGCSRLGARAQNVVVIGGVQIGNHRNVSELSTRPTMIRAVRVMPAAFTFSRMSASVPFDEQFVRPRHAVGDDDRAIFAVVRDQRALHVRQIVDG